VLILVWGVESEGPVRAVLEELNHLGATVQLIDQRAVLETEVEINVAADVEGTLRMGGQVIDLAQVTACYLRPYDWTGLPDVARAGANSVAWRHAADVHDVLACWSEVTPALVVNRFSAMASNGSKPYQLAGIREFGFRVPETIVTTEPAAVRSFLGRHGCVVYKSVSAIRSRVSRLTKGHLERLGDIASCPTQFQQYIPGTDYRVHVVGTEVYGCAVRSEADDYRYPGSHDVTIEAFRLPWEIEDRCMRLAAAMNLHVAGIDLRCGQFDGEWYCFEVNPSPGFIYYEDATGLPIAGAIARLLLGGADNRRATGPDVGKPIMLCEASNANHA
jgi:RimK-like ATP-grasp domain